MRGFWQSVIVYRRIELLPGVGYGDSRSGGLERTKVDDQGFGQIVPLFLLMLLLMPFIGTDHGTSANLKAQHLPMPVAEIMEEKLKEFQRPTCKIDMR